MIPLSLFLTIIAILFIIPKVYDKIRAIDDNENAFKKVEKYNAKEEEKRILKKIKKK
jgi:hypothetical protein